jgi:oligopeptidase A
MTDANPLLRDGAADAPPRFDEIRAEHVEPALRALVPRMLADLEALERDLAPTWQGTMAPLARLGEPVGFAWSVAGHLLAVMNSPELRQAYEAVQPDVVQAQMRLAQSVPIYRALKHMAGGEEWARLDAAQRRIVSAAIRDAELAGVGLEGAARDRYQAIELELAELGTRFSNHLLDATKAFAITLTAPEEIEGLPASARAAAAQAAGAASPEAGPWKITLDIPSFLPFLEHARRRDLRETLYRAYVTRASAGELDNSEIVERILRLRREQAELLGYPSYAEVSLAAKMAPGIAAVEKLLGELRQAALPKARAELDELLAYARAHGFTGEALEHWDVPFWAERLREERYAYTDEELRPYFALPRVLEGLYATARRVFGVTVRPADGEVPVWHPDVRCFRVFDGDGAPGRELASFYLDPYSRPATKRGGAWMGDAVGRKRRPDGSVRLPAAYLVCNATPPVGAEPALMTFREVETLFHEFGHALQHMLTTVDHEEAAGIRNVEWDAVELPSQFLENWAYTDATAADMARHYQTGAPLPAALLDKLRAARTYRAGSQTARQVYLATLDLELHHGYLAAAADRSAFAVQRRVAADNTVMPPLPEDRFLCSFAHIFAGGYAAGYYSYKWAEVLAADAFAAFEEAGLDRPEAVAATGRRFRDTVLALGGSRHPLEVFRAFRGRDPSVRPLLVATGLAETA